MSDSLNHYLQQLEPHLSSHDTRDLCINPDGLVFVESSSGWSQLQGVAQSANFAAALAAASAKFNNESLADSNPILSGSLPGGQRIQIVASPVVEKGTSITIRKPSDKIWTVDELAAAGLFAQLSGSNDVRASLRSEILQAYERARVSGEAADWASLFRALVEGKLNLVVSGPMGSGKTTLAKALMRFIPSHERLITIEDAREIQLPDHPNKVHLLYARSGRGVSGVTPTTLLQSSLRMKGSRICLSELRGEEAYDYLSITFAAHPGSITTVHGNSAGEVPRRLAMLCMESEKGRALRFDDLLQLIDSSVDAVVQLAAHHVPGQGIKHVVQEIAFAQRWSR